MKNHVMEIHVRRGLTVLILSLNGKKEDGDRDEKLKE